jgi:hypothetical protein
LGIAAGPAAASFFEDRAGARRVGFGVLFGGVSVDDDVSVDDGLAGDAEVRLGRLGREGAGLEAAGREDGVEERLGRRAGGVTCAAGGRGAAGRCASIARS